MHVKMPTSTESTESYWELIQTMYAKHLVQCLAHSEQSVSGSFSVVITFIMENTNL